MICMNCGKQIPEDLDFCPYCGADRGEELSRADGAGEKTAPAPRRRAPRYAPPARGRNKPRFAVPGKITLPSLRTILPRKRETLPRERAPEGENPAPRRKKLPLVPLLALVLATVLLVVGGNLIYRKGILPRRTLREADRLVEALDQSPLGESAEDFRLRADFDQHEYSRILLYPETRQKVGDYLHALYYQENYPAWIHAVRVLEESGVFDAGEQSALLVNRSDPENLFAKGWAVNLKNGWYFEVSNREALYEAFPDFKDQEKYICYAWGDFFAARSLAEGWTLFYRGWELKGVSEAYSGATSDFQIEYTLQGARLLGDLMIMPFAVGLETDGYLVLNTASGESCVTYYR